MANCHVPAVGLTALGHFRVLLLPEALIFAACALGTPFAMSLLVGQRDSLPGP